MLIRSRLLTAELPLVDLFGKLSPVDVRLACCRYYLKLEIDSVNYILICHASCSRTVYPDALGVQKRLIVLPADEVSALTLSNPSTLREVIS